MGNQLKADFPFVCLLIFIFVIRHYIVMTRAEFINIPQIQVTIHYARSIIIPLSAFMTSPICMT